LVQYAYRLTEEKIVTEKSHKNSTPTTKTLSILKYDSNDDGEDGAGIQLSQLLQLRKEMNVLVVVTRWFGGIHLGSKRFAHIVAAAQCVLVEYHATTASSCILEKPRIA
jgi:putative IMPACT (imprinted ancient) family translation regulator